MTTPQGQYSTAQQPMTGETPGYGQPGNRPPPDGDEWTRNTGTIKRVIGLISALSTISTILESLSLIFSTYNLVTLTAAPGIWTGVLGMMCGRFAFSSTKGKWILAAVTFTVLYMVALAVQVGLTATSVIVLSFCLSGTGYFCQTGTEFIAILQIGILTSGGLQGFLMLFVTGFFCKRGCRGCCSCCCCHKGRVYPESWMIQTGTTSVPIQQGVVTLNETDGPGATSDQTGGPDAHIPVLSDRATVAKLPGRYVAKRSPKDFGIFAQNFQEKLTGEQVRTVARYISNSPDDLALILSADDTDDYSSGKKNGGDLMLALREKGIIFRASDEVWYYDELARIFMALGLRALKEELMTEMSDKAPATKPETGQDMDAKLLMKELEDTLKLNAENAAMAAGQGASGRPSQDNRAVKTKLGTFVAHKDPSNFGVFVDNFNGRVTDVQTKKMAQCVFLLNEGDFDLQVQVLTALELSELERGNRKGGYLLEKLLGKGLIFKGSDGTYYYDGLAKVLKAIGEMGLLNEMLDEKTNRMGVAGEEDVEYPSSNETTVVNQMEEAGNPCRGFFVSKEHPTDYGKFAIKFSGSLNSERLINMVELLFLGGESMFGRIIITAEHREQFRSGSKFGRQLLDKMKEKGAISKGHDGIFNYNGLARILDAVDAQDLKNELLVDNSSSEADEALNMGDTWKTETMIAKESPRNFGKFANSFCKYVCAEEVANIAHYAFHSKNQFHLQVLTADELHVLHEQNNRSPGQLLLKKLKDRGIIYKGSDDLYYYDGLLIILKAVNAHDLINRLLVKKTENDQGIVQKDQDTEEETSSYGRSLVARRDRKDFGLFEKAFADRMTQENTVELARYISHSRETTLGVQVLSADELEEFEKGEKMANHLISKLKECRVIFRDSDSVLYYDKLAELLEKVGLQHIGAALLEKVVDDQDSGGTVGSITAKEAPDDFGFFIENFKRKIRRKEVKRLANYIFNAGEREFQRTVLTANEHTGYKSGHKDGANLLTKLREQGVIVSDAEGVFYYDGLARILRAVGLHKINRELLDLTSETDESSTADTEEITVQDLEDQEDDCQDMVWVSSSAPSDFAAFRIQFGRCVRDEQVKDLSDYLSESSQLLREDDREEFLQQTNSGASILKALKQKKIIFRRNDGIFCYDRLVHILEKLGQFNLKRMLFTQIDASKQHLTGASGKGHRSIPADSIPAGQWVAAADSTNFTAFRYRFNREVTNETVYRIADYLRLDGEEEGLYSAPIVTPADLHDYKADEGGLKTGADLLKGIKDKGMIYKATDGVYYYDELVVILDVLELTGLISKLLIKLPTDRPGGAEVS